MNTIEKLNQLADFQAQRDLIDLHKKEAIELAFPDEVKKALADIDVEFGLKLDAVNYNIAELENEIKADVLTIGESVKGDYLQAVWSKGRTSWDTKALDKYGDQHPEVLRLKTIGQPSIGIRAVK